MVLNFKNRLYIGFALAILLSAISGIVSYTIFSKQTSERVWLRHARSIVDSSKNLQEHLIDMETGHRGFLFTQQIQFLEPYTNAVRYIGPEMASLKTLLNDDSLQEKRAVMLEQQVHGLLGFWQGTMANPDVSDQDTIVEYTQDEKKRVDAIRSNIFDLQKQENRLLNRRREEYDTLIHRATIATTIDSILGEVIIIILIYFIFSEFRKRRRLEEQLKGSIGKLEDQRTVLQSSENNLTVALHDVEDINKQLEKFVYTIAHDIKSPLAGISGVLSLLEKDKVIVANPQLFEFIDRSSTAAQYLGEMVSSLLEYSRLSASQQTIELVNTKELVQQIAVLMFPPACIKITVADQMPVFKTKKIKIEQVFQNLISNAIKYNDKPEGHIAIGYDDRGEFYEFFVQDNGQGIPEKNKYNIFQLFKTGNNKATRETSTGFGLNIVKLIVEEQGGKVWVESIPAQGSKFIFQWRK